MLSFRQRRLEDAIRYWEKATALMARREWDRPLLEELSAAMRDASICGLGQAAPNPLLTLMRYFPEEFSR